jgi:hypothetical protein
MSNVLANFRKLATSDRVHPLLTNLRYDCCLPIAKPARNCYIQGDAVRGAREYPHTGISGPVSFQGDKCYCSNQVAAR